MNRRWLWVGDRVEGGKGWMQSTTAIDLGEEGGCAEEGDQWAAWLASTGRESHRMATRRGVPGGGAGRRA